MSTQLSQENALAVTIRRASIDDDDAIVALDSLVTGENKTEYWADFLQRFAGKNRKIQRHFLVAETSDKQLAGFIAGEIRAWEFGSPPCGWVIALNVDPKLRERSVGTQLLDALCDEMKTAGVTKIRTMVRGDDKVNLSFFRGEGLAAGPYIELERRLK